MKRIVPVVCSLIAVSAAAGKRRFLKPRPLFRQSLSTGTVTEGARADLVLLDDDPLRDIASTRRIHGVMVRGRWLDRAGLDRMRGRFRRDGPP